MIQDRLRCPAGHTDKAVDGWTFSWKWLDRWRDGWTNGHRDGWTGRHRQGHVQLDIRTVLCMDTMAGYTHRQTEGPHVHTHSRSSRTDNCMSSQTHGHYTCGWTDTCPARPFSSPPMHINALKMHFFCPQGPSPKPAISHPCSASTLFPTVHGFGVSIGLDPSPTPGAWAGRWTGIGLDRLTPGVGAGQRFEITGFAERLLG